MIAKLSQRQHKQTFFLPHIKHIEIIVLYTVPNVPLCIINMTRGSFGIARFVLQAYQYVSQHKIAAIRSKSRLQDDWHNRIAASVADCRNRVSPRILPSMIAVLDLLDQDTRISCPRRGA